MVSNHHLSYHKQNILSSQDGAPPVNVGGRVEVCQLLPLSPPLPHSQCPI